MDDNIHKPSLYKWKRQTSKSSSRTYSRSQQCKTSDDIQDWIKKVEQASDRATEAVLGTSHWAGRERGRQQALCARQHVRQNDQVLTEAQELLNDWMQEKLCLDGQVEDEEEDTAWARTPVPGEVRREWDRLVGNTDWEVEVTPRTKVKIQDRDPYGVLDYSDEEGAVNSILSHMMDTPVVQPHVLQDMRLDADKPEQDPRLKMELRHKQVKENRERRARQLEQRRRQQQEKKDSLHKAKQILIKEERNREREARREEEEVKRDMALIKKQMEADRRQQQEKHQKELREREVREAVAREEAERRLEEERASVRRQHQQEELLRRRQRRGLEEARIRQEAHRIKCLQRHFSAWYGTVLERRLQMGKAGAMADWKLLLRVWNSWRSHARRCQLDTETQRYQQAVIHTHRKQQMAEQHYRSTVMRRCLSAWGAYVKLEQDRRNLESEQNKTRSKMLALLDAAASGQLWSQEGAGPRDENRETRKEGGGKDSRNNNRLDLVEHDLDDFFHQKSHVHTTTNQDRALSSKSDSKLDSERSGVSERSGRSNERWRRSSDHRVPTQAWQVTRKHVNLTKEEIASMAGQDIDDISHHSETKMRRHFGKQPWMNTHYVINNFENRYTAQQKVLSEQQKQIKEQKRMIEELQYRQNQQTHMEDVARQQLVQRHLSQHSMQTSSIPGAPSAAVIADTPCAPGTQGTVSDGGRQRTLLNNLSTTGPHSTSNVSVQQRNEVRREKQTNLVLETARTNTSGQSTNRSGASSTQTGRTTGSNKYLHVLKNMEERANERRRLKAEREERRRLEEEQRLMELEQEEEALREQMAEERRAQAVALREKRRLEKQRETERRRELVELKEKTTLAEQHYTQAQLRYRGIRPLTRLVQLATSNWHRAEQHHTSCLLKTMLCAWRQFTQCALSERHRLADEMNSFLAVKRCFARWKLLKHHQRIEMEKARRHNHRIMLRRVILAWADRASEEKFASWERERVAKEHYFRTLLKQSLDAWRILPVQVKLEADREKRRADMRKKVAHLLPDFEGIIKSSAEL